jgi:hypothetical protein
MNPHTDTSVTTCMPVRGEASPRGLPGDQNAKRVRHVNSIHIVLSTMVKAIEPSKRLAIEEEAVLT